MSGDKARLHGNDEPEAVSMKDAFQLEVQWKSYRQKSLADFKNISVWTSMTTFRKE